MSPSEMRIQKFLSRAGVSSRRGAEEMILAGRVRVNGEVLTELGRSIDPTRDRVEVDGRSVAKTPPTRWVLLNKPAGFMTTRSDPQGRPTVYSLLDEKDSALPYVGRLDRDTEGLLLFTNEGDLIHALTHPSTGLLREYRALVGGVPEPETLVALERGIELEDGIARAERVRMVRKLEGGKGSVVTLAIREGRKREVRRLLEAAGHSVRALRRVAFGPITLEGLRVGGWRELRPPEVAALRRAARGESPTRGGSASRGGSSPRRESPPRSGGKGRTKR